MSMASIRAYYGVPACRGGLVKFRDTECRITSADRTGMYLWIYDLRTPKVRMKVHPTWEMHYVLCDNAVEDKDGDLGPCERPACGYRIDEEFGSRYPVCRQHHVPPFERCDDANGTVRVCTVHYGMWRDESGWCDKAFEVTP